MALAKAYPGFTSEVVANMTLVQQLMYLEGTDDGSSRSFSSMAEYRAWRAERAKSSSN